MIDLYHGIRLKYIGPAVDMQGLVIQVFNPAPWQRYPKESWAVISKEK